MNVHQSPDVFSNHTRKERSVTVFLKLIPDYGFVKGFDNFAEELKVTVSSSSFTHALSTIIPAAPLTS